MLDFDELEELEQANEPPPKTEEERRQDEEAAAFKRLLDAEVVAEQRLHAKAESEEGILGVLIEIQAEEASRGGIFFCDAVNTAVRRMRKLLASQKDNGSAADVKSLEARVDALAASLDWLMQQRFQPYVVDSCQQQAECFQGKQGLSGLLEEWLAPAAKRRRHAELRVALEAAFRKAVAIQRRLISCACPWPMLAESQQEIYAGHFTDLFRAVFPRAPAPLYGRWIEQLGAEAVEDEHEVLLRVHESGEERTLMLPTSTTVQMLHEALSSWLGQPCGLELFSAAPGVQGEARPTGTGRMARLGGASKVLDVGGVVLVCGLRVPLPPPAEAACEQPPGWLPDWVLEWRTKKYKVCKTTLVSATQLLYELRAAFIDEAFQERYRALRREAKQGNQAHRESVEMIFKVQSTVLPKFGFEASPRGVQEMRDEMPIYAGVETYFWAPHRDGCDEVVWKIRRDIHIVLDMNQSVPRMPVSRPIVPPRFPVAEKELWLRHLADEGFAVVADVADEAQVRIAYSLLWDFIETTDGSGAISRSDVSTWHDADKAGHGWPAGKADGIIHGRGIGQSQALWFLRGLRSVKRVFADLWGTEHLVTSFDGAGVFRPYGHNPGWKIQKTDQGWCHVDQAHKKRGLHCIQGLLTLKDATEHTGGLVVVPGTHRFFGSDILRRYEASRDGWNFISLRANDPVLTEGGGGPRLVCAKAGDLLLWDSRTVHCNTLPLSEDPALLLGTDLIRAVCYICMTPAAWCSQEVVSKRGGAFNLGATTSHWPHEYFVSTTHPRQADFQLTGDQLRLVCPQLASDWEKDNASKAPEPGRISLLPAARFVAAQDTPILSNPTQEWGSGIGTLRRGQQVEGHVFGSWLHLGEKLPVEGQASQSESGEAWASLATLTPAA